MKKFDVTFRRSEYFVVSVEAKDAESAGKKAEKIVLRAEQSAETRDLDKMFLCHGDMEQEKAEEKTDETT